MNRLSPPSALSKTARCCSSRKLTSISCFSITAEKRCRAEDCWREDCRDLPFCGGMYVGSGRKETGGEDVYSRDATDFYHVPKNGLV